MARRDNPPSEPLLDTRCAKHQFEPAVDRCRTCDQAFCTECLVYSFGPTKPPFCVHCALSAAGVRVRGARPAKVSRRELRRREKEAKAAARAAEEAAAREPVIDWSIPRRDDEPEPNPAFDWFDRHDDDGGGDGRIVPF